MESVKGNIVDPIGRKTFKGEIQIECGKISQITEMGSVPDQYILPGLVDSHIHIESSMLVPSEFARIAVRHGTVATVSDPHEIANVCGIEGINFMINNGEKVPLKFHFGVPSCVPATPAARRWPKAGLVPSVAAAWRWSLLASKPTARTRGRSP